MTARTIGFDLDGVLARPATYFINLASIFAGRSSASNRAWEPPQPGLGGVLRAILSKGPSGENQPPEPAVTASAPRRAIEKVRYALRVPMPETAEVLDGLRPLARLVLVTNRNAVNEAYLHNWLQKHGLSAYFDAVHLNNTGEQGLHFKLRRLRELEIDEYVEDNPEIAEHLARNGVRVYFRRWALVRTPAHEGIFSYQKAEQLLAAVRSAAAGSG
ncbi:MAG: hypothetical protein GEU28_08935 [Dehalococcoidia bacterium]|nr:hypothetical protein [Dehalococcoidia bacterium]